MQEIRFNLTPYVDDLTEIMKDIALKRYGKSIAIIAMYGSRARGDFEDDSDLEFFSVIEDGKKVDVEFTFNGMPCDMWGQTWEYFEKVSTLDSYWLLPAGTMSYCQIIYTRSESDKTRFESLIHEATQSGKYYDKNIENASKFLDGMYKYLGKIQHAKHMDDLHEARDACWHLIISATYIVAHVNSKPLQNNWGQNLHELYTFEKQPKNLPTSIESLVVESNFDSMLKIGTELIENLRQFMISVTKDIPEDSELEMLRCSDSLAYLNKIKKTGRNQDILGAGYAVHDFQALIARDLIRIKKDWNKSSNFLLYKEYEEEYNKSYVDFFDAISNRDFRLLQRQADSMYDNLLEYNKTNVPNFLTLDEIKKEYL